jgi:hypothetical protein
MYLYYYHHYSDNYSDISNLLHKEKSHSIFWIFIFISLLYLFIDSYHNILINIYFLIMVTSIFCSDPYDYLFLLLELPNIIELINYAWLLYNEAMFFNA